jgi:iron complex outermembrane receptor protein
MRFTNLSYLRSWCLALIIPTSTVFAQTSGAPPPSGTEPQGLALAEIVVTAQKREERLQDVPIAVTALTSDVLAKERIQTSQDVQFQVPALDYIATGGYAQPYLRGIGSAFTQPDTDATVATYIDGAFVSNIAATITNLLGVERVEVLEGPQGTLYGRNAVGGAINIITLTPGSEFEAKATSTFGDYDRKEGTLQVSGPITDTLSAGLYAADSYRETFYKVVRPASIPNQDANGEHMSGLRGKFVWHPIDDFKLTGTIERDITRSYEAGLLRNIQANGLAYADFGAPPIFGNYVATNDGPTYNNNFITEGTVRTEVGLGFADLLGVTNFRNLDSYAANDIDGTALNILYSQGNQPNSQQYSQELQLLSPAASRIKWIAGLYFFHEKGGFDPNTSSSPVLFPGYVTNENFGLFATKSYAGFAQATVPITDGMRLTVGGRYTVDKKEFNGLIEQTDDPYAGGNAVVGTPTVIPEMHAQWDKFTPKVTLDYRIGGTLLYATYSEGFKSGTYNVATAATPGPVNPEDLKSYEIGTKSDLMGGRLRVNSSAYYYDYTNLQVQIVSTAGGITTTALQNAADAEAYGVEVNADFALTRDLQITGAMSAEKSKYTRFPDYAGVVPAAVGNATASIDATGNELSIAPKWVLTAGADYSREVPWGGKIDTNLNWYFNDGFFWTPQNTIRQEPYNLVNGFLGYTFPGNLVQLSMWVTNLTNTHYLASGIPISVFGTFVQDSPPRMFGGTITLKFK